MSINGFVAKSLHTAYKICIIFTLLVFVFSPFASFYKNFPVYGDELEDINKQIEQKQKERAGKESSIKESEKAEADAQLKKLPLTEQLIAVTADLEQTQKELSARETEIKTKEEEIAAKQKELDSLTEIINKQLLSVYVSTRTRTLSVLFSGKTPVEIVRDIVFRNASLKSLSSNLRDLQEKQALLDAQKRLLDEEKKTLEVEKADLAKRKAELDAQIAEIQADINSQNAYQANLKGQVSSLNKQISALSAKQQQIIKAKNGAENGSVSDQEPPKTNTPAPPFKPAFGAFSYGAYTHYNGMSQYGAKGRALAGEDYTKILKFYYKVGTVTVTNFATIDVQGYGVMDTQKYLYGLAEMPASWPAEALKAQAVAARSYAYKAKKPICTTQSCQVFSKSKSDNPPAAWKAAVDATKDVVLNNPTTSQYSSTTGGYINNVGWDTKAGSWPTAAYENLAASPWFYKAWYTKSMTSSDTCGRTHPWLTEKEMADILNSWVVFEKGTAEDKTHISPVTTSCWGGTPYSLDEMAAKADTLGGKYTSVSAVDVLIGSTGTSTGVKFTTNKGVVTITGTTFRTVFNLRAPGYISLKSRLYEIEKR